MMSVRATDFQQHQFNSKAMQTDFHHLKKKKRVSSGFERRRPAIGVARSCPFLCLFVFRLQFFSLLFPSCLPDRDGLYGGLPGCRPRGCARRDTRCRTPSCGPGPIRADCRAPRPNCRRIHVHFNEKQHSYDRFPKSTERSSFLRRERNRHGNDLISSEEIFLITLN